MVQIKSWKTGEVLFEYEGTIKEAVEEAVRQGISLKDADLSGAYLLFADLRGANLESANLFRATLAYADLRGAKFERAIFKNAILDYVKGLTDSIMPLVCPSEGSFIAWKKVGNKLVKLEIPANAKRSSATTHKCRCSKAKVLAITNFDETESFDEVINGNYVPLITYKVGEIVYPDSFDENRWNECSHGIHFFMDKEDAINW